LRIGKLHEPYRSRWHAPKIPHKINPSGAKVFRGFILETTEN
jgi:hypothetical protein